MGLKIFCDRCGKEIVTGHDMIKIEATLDGKLYWKYLHRDCFNYQFSTDIVRIKNNE